MNKPEDPRSPIYVLPLHDQWQKKSYLEFISIICHFSPVHVFCNSSFPKLGTLHTGSQKIVLTPISSKQRERDIGRSQINIYFVGHFFVLFSLSPLSLSLLLFFPFFITGVIFRVKREKYCVNTHIRKGREREREGRKERQKDSPRLSVCLSVCQYTCGQYLPKGERGRERERMVWLTKAAKANGFVWHDSQQASCNSIYSKQAGLMKKMQLKPERKKKRKKEKEKGREGIVENSCLLICNCHKNDRAFFPLDIPWWKLMVCDRTVRLTFARQKTSD